MTLCSTGADRSKTSRVASGPAQSRTSFTVIGGRSVSERREQQCDAAEGQKWGRVTAAAAWWPVIYRGRAEVFN